jgi:hypothetical protein
MPIIIKKRHQRGKQPLAMWFHAIAVFRATCYIHVGTDDSPRNASTERQI